jgi:hypothetical protein
MVAESVTNFPQFPPLISPFHPDFSIIVRSVFAGGRQRTLHPALTLVTLPLFCSPGDEPIQGGRLWDVRF